MAGLVPAISIHGARNSAARLKRAMNTLRGGVVWAATHSYARARNLKIQPVVQLGWDDNGPRKLPLPTQWIAVSV